MSATGVTLIDPKYVLAKSGLSAGMRVADFGCGRTGHFVFPAARVVGDTGVVYAVDIMKEILESIRSRSRSEGFDNVQTIWSDIEQVGKTPIPEQSLDICFFMNVLFQLKNRQASLSEAARLLKTSGELIVVDWAKKLGNLGPTEETMLNSAMIVGLAQQVGFKEVDNFAAGDYHYCHIFRKM